MNCTWDEGETARDKKLTNVSAWRQLTESDFQQYIASEDSEDDSEQDDSDSNCGGSSAKQAKWVLFLYIYLDDNRWLSIAGRCIISCIVL